MSRREARIPGRSRRGQSGPRKQCRRNALHRSQEQRGSHPAPFAFPAFFNIVVASSEGRIMRRVAISIIAVALAAGAARAETPVERGSYLVNTIMTCANCHSPKGPPSAVAGKDFSGGLRFDEPPFDVTASNITSDKETGIGNWSAADIKRL